MWVAGYRSEFVRRARDTMARLYDANIANLLGSVEATSGDSGGSSHAHHQQQQRSTLNWFVFEHLPLGDLKQFLRRHRAVCNSASADTTKPPAADNTLRSESDDVQLSVWYCIVR